MCPDMRTDMCPDMRTDMCPDKRTDMCPGMCVGTCAEKCADMGTDVCAATDIRADTWHISYGVLVGYGIVVVSIDMCINARALHFNFALQARATTLVCARGILVMAY